ncbi:cold shock domain-containing protein [Oscillatoria sp. FACHB-1406]|uniref:cold shock domain-containing protein n=1 Tax=Oscillatoria sp. FACHB-1406 TaxID=2692846 RepID=UPI001A7F0DE8|nr:cold shock domain-containing protein [Oscillatoria sp. FACHB-1406]
MNIGKIDWFGGINNKTGQVNNFGFIKPRENEGSEGIYLNRKNVPPELQARLEPGLYVEFELYEDDLGRKAAILLDLVYCVGVVSWYKDGRGYINCENRPDVRVLDAEYLRKDDIVFFSLKHNAKLNKDEAVLVKKILPSEEDRFIIEKCANSNIPSIYRQFLLNYALTLPASEAVELILERVEKLNIGEKNSLLRGLIEEGKKY